MCDISSAETAGLIFSADPIAITLGRYKEILGHWREVRAGLRPACMRARQDYHSARLAGGHQGERRHVVHTLWY